MCYIEHSHNRENRMGTFLKKNGPVALLGAYAVVAALFAVGLLANNPARPFQAVSAYMPLF